MYKRAREQVNECMLELLDYDNTVCQSQALLHQLLESSFDSAGY